MRGRIYKIAERKFMLSIEIYAQTLQAQPTVARLYDRTHTHTY